MGLLDVSASRGVSNGLAPSGLLGMRWNWWTVGAPAFVIFLFWWNQSLIGFVPADDGFVLAQSWRLILGQTIHVDFTSPRPLGSAVIHVPEALNPWGTLAFSRLVVSLQMLWIAAAGVSLVSWRLGFSDAQRFMLLSTAFILNVNTWPVMAWHTIDGLFLGITALWAVVRAHKSEHPAAWWVSAWLLAGAAPLVKQGFAVVPIAVTLLMLTSGQKKGFQWIWAAGLPLVGYLSAARWQVGTIASQMYTGQGIGEALRPLTILVEVALSKVAFAAVLLSAVASILTLASRRWSRHDIPLRLLSASLVVLPTILIGMQQGFAAGGTWAFVAVLVSLVMATTLVGRWNLLCSTACLLLLAWAASISWGAPAPTLVAGSLLVGAMIVALRGHGQNGDVSSEGRLAITCFLVVTTVVISLLVLANRNREVYWQGPRDGVVASVDASSMWGIKMTPESAAYFGMVEGCVRSVGVSRGAIMPDGPGLYPLLRLVPVFAVDWWWTEEEIPPDIASRMDESIDELNASGDWIVLRQGFDIVREFKELSLEQVIDPTLEPIGVRGTGNSLQQLNGEPIRCGSLSGVFRPPSAQ